MTHLTLTGPYAGQILCGKNKQQSIAEGNQHLHAIYFDRPGVDQSQLCPECLTIVREVMAEDEGDQNHES